MGHLTFTGTRIGMTERQVVTLHNLALWKDIDQIHHGACVGADREFHFIARLHRINLIYTHPSNFSQYRWAVDVDSSTYQLVIETIKAPLIRNRKMVEASGIVIACPSTQIEELHSGTWSTVRYARKLGKDLFIINPDGGIQ